MNTVEILTLLITIPAVLIGLSIGLWTVRRMGIVPVSNSNLPRKLFVAAALTIAILGGLLWSIGSAPPSVPTLAYGVVMWLVAMFVVFRRPKGV